MLSIQIEKRDIKANLDAMRKKGQMPAVFYGKKEDSTPITMASAEFLKVWRKAGESSVVTLQGLGEDREALIHDIDFDPVLDTPRHVDFYVFEKGHKVKVDIPLEFTGEAAAIKTLGGTLVKVMREVKIEAMPKDLPQVITVDISPLETFESQILAKDLKLPAGVVLVDSEDEVVALVAAAKEFVEEEVAPVDLTAIEVEKKGKKEEEGEAPAAE